MLPVERSAELDGRAGSKWSLRSASQGRCVHAIYLWKYVNVPVYRDAEILVDDCTSSEVTNLDNKVEAENTTK